MSLFGRPTDPFQHMINLRSCHSAAHMQFKHCMASTDEQTRQEALRRHHNYLKSLLDEAAGHDTDLFKSLAHIEKVVSTWTTHFRQGDRKAAQASCEAIAFEFRDTCATKGFRELIQKERNELLLDICLAYELAMGTTTVFSHYRL